MAASAPPAAADTTHVVVRFRDAATGTSSADDLARLQAIAVAARTGLGHVEVTRDGAYRVALAPPLSDDGGRAAVARLRNDAAVLYADSTGPALPRGSRPAQQKGPSPRLDRIVVKYRDPQVAADAEADLPLAAARVAQLAARAGRPLAFGRTVSWARAHVVQLMTTVPQDEAEAIARAIEQDPDVEWAQPDYRRFRQFTPNDPLWSSQWHYMTPPGEVAGVNLPAAWDLTTGWSGLRVAVLDTGILKTHPDLAGRWIGGYDFIFDWVYANDNSPVPPGACVPGNFSALCNNRDADPADPGDWVSFEDDAGISFGGYLQGCGFSNSSWHGTHVAGTIGAATSNALGVAGVNHVGRIVPVRVLGKCGGYSSDIADAIVWSSGGPVAGVPANAYPARVINMSLGGGGDCASDTLTQTAINAALAAGTAVIVAAGNEDDDAQFYTPASCSGVVTVAALGRSGQRASYSNFGTVVEIAAPGGSDGQTILSTLNSGTTVPLASGMNYVGYQGTSMATPHTAGVASLLLGLKPALTPAQLTTILQNTSRSFPTGTIRNCNTSLCGAGMLDALAAISNVLATGGPGSTPLVQPNVTLGTSANPVGQGGNVTFTANVGSGAAGSVAFRDNDVVLPGCGAVALVGGAAQCTAVGLANGTHPIRASYSGSATHTPRDSAILYQLLIPPTPQPSTTTVASTGANPTLQGASVTLTASVTGFGPSGFVEFRANNVPIAGCQAVALPAPGDVRTAQCTTTALPVGSVAIAANYSGDGANQPSTGNASHGVYTASACATFNDVAGSDTTFCPNVQWLYNRVITQGCNNVSYCPSDSVIRLQMAAFMNREGAALTPVDLPLVSVQLNGALTGANGVTCFHPGASFTAVGFPRKARLRAFANLYSPTTNTTVTVRLAYSTNGGGAWTLIPPAEARVRVQAGVGDDRTVNLEGDLDLVVGQNYLFGLAFSASPNATVGIYCANQARIFNRNGTSVPY